MSPNTSTRLLVINPNITEQITDSFRGRIDKLHLPDTVISYWTNTGGSGPSTLSTNAEIEESATQCLKPLLEIAPSYDGFLIAAYTLHPLVHLLQAQVGSKPVVGMFQASVTTALHMLRPKTKFAIVTTVPGFIEHLNVAVADMLGSTTGESSVFAGTTASGITWDILVKQSSNVAKRMMMDTVRQLIRNKEIQVVCLGGAILHGMSSWVKEACILELGENKGREVRIIDPFLPGVVTLNGLVHMSGLRKST